MELQYKNTYFGYNMSGMMEIKFFLQMHALYVFSK